jgi:hypothetical protein
VEWINLHRRSWLAPPRARCDENRRPTRARAADPGRYRPGCDYLTGVESTAIVGASIGPAQPYRLAATMDLV